MRSGRVSSLQVSKFTHVRGRYLTYNPSRKNLACKLYYFVKIKSIFSRNVVWYQEIFSLNGSFDKCCIHNLFLLVLLCSLSWNLIFYWQKAFQVITIYRDKIFGTHTQGNDSYILLPVASFHLGSCLLFLP